MTNSVIQSYTADKEISTFLPIISRVYGSTTRLVAVPDGSVTSDIRSVLLSSKKSEIGVDVIRKSVEEQYQSIGSGGRTVAFASCLFYRSFCHLQEESIPRDLVWHATEQIMRLIIHHVESHVMPLSQIPSVHSIRGLCRGMEYWTLLWDMFKSLPPHQKLRVQYITVSSNDKSEVVSGNIFKYPFDGKVVNKTRCLVVCNDIVANPKHVGYKDLTSERNIITQSEELLKSRDTWHEKVMTLVDSLRVNTIIATGTVDSVLTSLDHVMVIEKADWSTVNDFLEAFHHDGLPFLEAATTEAVLDVEISRHSEEFILVKPSPNQISRFGTPCETNKCIILRHHLPQHPHLSQIKSAVS